MLGSWLAKLTSGFVVAATLVGAATPALAAEGNQAQRAKPLLFRAVVHQVSEQTGLDRCDILGDLAEGKTFTQIAQSNGSSAQAITDAVLIQIKARLDKAVANNKITQEQADKVYERMSSRLSVLMKADMHERIEKLYQRLCSNEQ